MEQSLDGMIPLPATFLPSQSHFGAFLSLASFRESLKPWMEFFAVSHFTKPDMLALTRLRYNLKYYQANYLLITLLVMLVYLLSEPLLVILVLGLAAAWSKLATIEGKQRPLLPQILGKEVTITHKKWAMGLFSGSLILYLGSAVLMAACGMAAGLTLVHSVTRQIPENELPLEYQPPKLQV